MHLGKLPLAQRILFIFKGNRLLASTVRFFKPQISQDTTSAAITPFRRSGKAYLPFINLFSNYRGFFKIIFGDIGTLDHKNPPLCDKVLKIIKPIYESLSSKELLTRCLGSETQNNNESLNSLIWTFTPKHVHSGTPIEIAKFLAVCIFNEGFIP